MTRQFITALDAIRANGVALNVFCNETGIDRRNLSRMLNDPEHFYPRPKWLSAICTVYGVRPDFLILGKGKIFR